MPTLIDRRHFLTGTLCGLARAQDRVMRPVVSEEACPLTRIEPLANDGYRGVAFVRKPPGSGPFPAIIWIHGGLETSPTDWLQETARAPHPSRFLAAGYVVIVPTYRSRDIDPQSRISLEDCLAVVEHARKLPYVDGRSVIVYGCSGGGDLALEIAAARADVCAIVPEEPASVMFSGLFTTDSPKRGVRFSPLDTLPIMRDPKKFYTSESQRFAQAKISRIQCPILIIQGAETAVLNKFNAETLIPELRAAGKKVEVISYSGEPHCFCFTFAPPGVPGGRPPGMLPGEMVNPARHNPASALKAFQDIDAFCR
jgi:dipeptidyl aminopeptidase/acylaminoacyl peptidase